LCHLPHGFDVYFNNLKVDVKTMRKIALIFVAFSEKLTFKKSCRDIEFLLDWKHLSQVSGI
jgi:hypothetical protein